MDRDVILFLVCILLLACVSLAGWFAIIAYIVGQACP